MILESLTLENFGAYAGRQKIELTPPKTEQPIVLVGGQNGEGKTTLMEAVLLALYGPHAPGARSRSMAYERYLRSRIHSADTEASDAAVEVSFSASIDGESESFRLRRSWTAVDDTKAREKLTVWRGDAADPQLSDGWSEFVETLIPRGIAPLFFFDGERIEELADLDRAAETIETAISALLGLELVDRLNADLVAIERRHVTAGSDEALAAEVAHLESDLKQAEAKRQQQAQALAAARSKVDRAQREFERADERFRAAGGRSFENRAEREASCETARARLEAGREGLRTVATGLLPLLLLRDDLTTLADQSEAERDARRRIELAEQLELRDSLTLEWARESGLEGNSLKAFGKRLAEDRLTREDSDVEHWLGLGDSAHAELRKLVAGGLDIAAEAAKGALGAAHEAKSMLELAERRLAEVPTAAAVEDIAEERERRRSELVSAEQESDTAARNLEAAERERKSAAELHERQLRRIAEVSLGNDDSQRVFRHAEKTRQTLLELRQRAAASHMERIEALIRESLAELLRKDGLVAEVSISPETHALRLYGRGGREIDPKELSAGERQLTALSLLWGLARASRLALPLIIDTPLGRLDASHRSLFVSRYLPRASHQVIVLSTDTEVDRSLLNSLNGAVGRSYHLEHNPATHTTEFSEGYFFSEIDLPTGMEAA